MNIETVKHHLRMALAELDKTEPVDPVDPVDPVVTQPNAPGVYLSSSPSGALDYSGAQIGAEVAEGVPLTLAVVAPNNSSGKVRLTFTPGRGHKTPMKFFLNWGGQNHGEVWIGTPKDFDIAPGNTVMLGLIPYKSGAFTVKSNFA
jgi:hypothetical protein